MPNFGLNPAGSETPLLLLAILIVGAAHLLWAWWSAWTKKKLIFVRRVGDRTGLPVAARGWSDITGIFPGASPRIFVHPSGDEVQNGEILFSALPEGQILYVAPNGEDFIPSDMLESVGSETKRAQEAIYCSVVEKIFQGSLLPRTESVTIAEYADHSVRAYLETRLHVSSAFARYSQ